MELVVNGKTYHKIFSAGVYPQGTYTVEDLQRIAAVYDVSVHEAPVWVGHTRLDDNAKGDREPRAIGWIDSCLVVGADFYVSFSHVSREFQYLTEEQIYKYCSAEFLNFFDADGNKVSSYLFALGLTNRPAVSMPPLKPKRLSSFSKDHEKAFHASFSQGKVALFNFELTDFNNQKKLLMNEQLKKTAEGLGIDVSQFTTDEALSGAVLAKFTELNGQVTTVTAERDALKSAGTTADDKKNLSPEMQAVFTRLEQAENARAMDALDAAVQSGKILEKDKDKWTGFVKSDIEGFKKVVATMEVHSMFAGKQVKDGGLSAGAAQVDEAVFIKPGTTEQYTYEEVIKDPKLRKKFTPEQVKHLQSKSSFARK